MSFSSCLVFFAIVAVCYLTLIYLLSPFSLSLSPSNVLTLMIRSHTHQQHTPPPQQRQQQGLPLPLPHLHPATTVPHASGSPPPSLCSHTFKETTTASLDRLIKRSWFNCTSMTPSTLFLPSSSLLSCHHAQLHHSFITRLFFLLCSSLISSALGGSSWTNKKNWLSGDHCQWYGVVCDHNKKIVTMYVSPLSSSSFASLSFSIFSSSSSVANHIIPATLHTTT